MLLLCVCTHACPRFFYVETVVFKTLVQTVHYHRRYMIPTTGDVVKQLTERLKIFFYYYY